MRMSVTELGRQTDIHTESIYRMVRKNVIPHVRVGKRIFFDRDAMKEFFGDFFRVDKRF